MAKGDLIRVPGYTQKITYNGNIEYRPWSEDLVGNQQTTRVEGDIQRSSNFTLNNFQIQTAPPDRTVIENYNKQFSNFYDLKSLTIKDDFTANAKKLLRTNSKIKLNVDYRNLSKMAYFGSANEYIRVTLENIILNWPASLYVSIFNTSDTYKLGDYTYDELRDITSFSVNLASINNKYDIILNKNGDVIDSYNQDNSLRNLSISYKNYVINYEDKEYDILYYEGLTPSVNEKIYLEVSGSPFGISATTLSSYKFHIKPNKLKCDEFFNSLENLERNLLNRHITPKYTAIFNYKIKTENNIVIHGTRNLTWPTSDGYNLDFNNESYISYIRVLLEIASESDNNFSDLMTRFLVSESISSFDTLPQINGSFLETEAQKMRKVLRIYGREFDEVKLWVDGIKKSNTITYDKYDNAPDQIVKTLAYTMGWDLTNSFTNDNFLNQFILTKDSTYSGHSVGYTPQEAEIEMWRRLILNSAFLFKSKGSRKAIEFLMRFVGAPKGLIDLNEYIYKVKNKIDMDLFYAVLDRYGLDSDLTNYSVDSEGYPKLTNRNGRYFQSKGGWYRQTYGIESNDHYLKGNNPHIGTYDSGQNYFEQLNDVIGFADNEFTPFTVTNTTYLTGSTNLFYNYNRGKFNNYTGKFYVDVVNKNDGNINNCVTPTIYVSPDPYPTAEQTICGCDCIGDDDMLSVCLKKNEQKYDCNKDLASKRFNETSDMEKNPYIFVYTKKTKNINGAYIGTYETIFREKECCKLDGGTSYFYEKYNTEYSNTNKTFLSVPLTSGYLCLKSEGATKDHKTTGGGNFLSCNWRLPFTSSDGMTFKTINNKKLSIEDITWKIGNLRYLKYVSPYNSWGVLNDTATDYLVGPPEFKYTNPADSGFCPLNITAPELVTDPVTNEKGYACKLLSTYYSLNTQALNEITEYAKTLYYKTTGRVGCLSRPNPVVVQTYTKSLYE
jgi:hypothetical protein